MDRNNLPIFATIVVEERTPHGVRATVDGRRRHFSSMNDLFRAAVMLAGGPSGKRKGV